jgi:hypothetical protein
LRTYEVTRTYLYELERISKRSFFVQHNSSDVQQSHEKDAQH